MRYASGFFASLSSGAQQKAFVKSLAELQDELGLLNDATVAGRLLDQLESARQDLAAPIATVRAALLQRAEDTARAQKTWKRYKAAKLPR